MWKKEKLFPTELCLDCLQTFRNPAEHHEVYKAFYGDF